MEKKEVLFILRRKDQTKAYRELLGTEKYNFHHLDQEGQTLPSLFLSIDVQDGFQFDIVGYIEIAVQYVKDNNIQQVLAATDLGDLVAGIVREKTGLPGCKIESSFICYHKYYTKIFSKLDFKFWYFAADLDNDDWKVKIKYPAYVKPPYFAGGYGQFVVRNENEMIQAISKIKKSSNPIQDMFKSMFLKHLDIKKFPLSIKNIVLVEELVEDSKMMVTEGWVDQDGAFHLWGHFDGLSFSKPVPCDFLRYTPSTTPSDVLDDIEKLVQKFCSNLNLRSVFFNVDLWVTTDPETGKVAIELIEINKRISQGLFYLYDFMNVNSNFEAAFLVSLRESDHIQRPIITSQHSTSGFFLIKTCISGPATDIFDFSQIPLLKKEHGGKFSVYLYIDEGDYVKQDYNKYGRTICRCHLVAESCEELKQQAYKITNQLLKQISDHRQI
ncbi:hypothetical protein LOTGIDRAFT_164236 [Lottia gigantea]|uniref:ATP-grasp domain-containing protein n=1 Tax=Lottia gigantea TaxID=225164 RepID=V4AAI5_LOTGI|nr:hypothetical protein LOTGIDRAFT_164236 [Lottia gigantea]ESO90316.1 hypothetical protein LOTGIDRAFT_164236 [Lottia gigantea]